MSILTALSQKNWLRGYGRGAASFVVLLLFAAGSGWGGTINVTGGATGVYDDSPPDLVDLINRNKLLGQNLSVNVPLPLVPDIAVGIGGGQGGIGGGGGGGLALTSLLSPGNTQSSNGGPLSGGFYGGEGTALDFIDDKGPYAGLLAGGGGGLTEGGGGFELLNAGPLNVGGGGGGSLGITAADLGMGGATTSVLPGDYNLNLPAVNTPETRGQNFAVSSGNLNVFGGSGAGAGVAVDLSVPGLAVALNLLLGPLGLGTDELLTAEKGDGAAVNQVTLTGGTVNMLGGLGGGGGIANVDLSFKGNPAGADGTGSTAEGVTISGANSVLNVYGGAGGGANATAGLGSAGGKGGGAKVKGGSMSGGTVNIYSGADGGDVTNELLGVVNVPVTALLDQEGVGGEGEGGSVSNFTLTGGTMNLYDGTSAHDPDTAAKYNATGDQSGDISGARADTITNNGGTLNLDGGALTGVYTQGKNNNGTGGTLILAGGSYEGTTKENAGGGLFSAGNIVSTEANQTLNGASFNGKVDTDAAGTGSSLLITNAALSSGADLGIGDNVTLDLSGDGTPITVDTGEAIRLDRDGSLLGPYIQNGGSLTLYDKTLEAGADGVTDIKINGGQVNSSGGRSEINGAEFHGNVTTDATGDNNSLRITDAAINGSPTDTLTIGTNVILDNAELNRGNLALVDGGTLSGTYTQNGGTLLLDNDNLAVDDDLTGINIKGGTVKAEGDSSITGATFSGNVATDATGDENSLLIEDATLGDNDRPAFLTIGDNVTLKDATLEKGQLAIDDGGNLAGDYTQDGGTLLLNNKNLEANAGDMGNIAINGGAVNATGDSSLTGASFSGNVTTDATGPGNSLLIEDATLGESATDSLTIGPNVTLKDAALEQGQLTLDGGDLAGTYTQTGGTLNLDNGPTTVTDGIITGGTVNSIQGDSVLTGVSFGGDAGTPTPILTTVNGGNSLTIAGATVGDGADLTIGDKVTLTDATLDGEGASVTLGDGGTLGGTAYTQKEGTLVLAGGDIAPGTTATFEGGAIDTGGTGDRTLDNAVFTGDVSTATTGGDLTIDHADIGDEANLSLGEGVTLTGTTLDEGTVTLDGGGLGAGYVQDGGDLVVAADGTHNVAGAEFKSGTITADGADAELTGGHFTGDVDTTAVNNGSLTLTDTVLDNANLTIGNDVTLKDGTLTTGSVTLGEGGKLEGTYDQSGGTLILATADSDALEDATLHISGGTVQSNVAGVVLDGASFSSDGTNNNIYLTTEGEGTLEIRDTIINGFNLVDSGDVDLTGLTEVTDGTLTLNSSTASLTGSYSQTGNGKLVFEDGNMHGLTSATFSGGEIEMKGNGALENVTFTNDVAITGDPNATLTLTDTTVDGGNLTLGSTSATGPRVAAEGNTTLKDGSITLNDEDALTGNYTQTGGTLNLDDGVNITGTEDNTYTFKGGAIDTVEGNNSILANATFDGNVTTDATGTDTSLIIRNADINSGELTIGTNVHLDNATLDSPSATIVLDDGGTLTGSYTQNDGTLVLAGGDFDLDTGENPTFAGGTIDTAGGAERTLDGAVFTDDVATKGSDGDLVITNADIAGGDLTIGEHVTLEDATLDNADASITLADGGTLGGAAYTQNDGTLILAGGDIAPETTTTFNGGAIDTGGTGDRTLEDAVFTGNVSTATAGGDLTIDNADIRDDANLTIGEGVTLTNTELDAGRTVTLDGGDLGEGYVQDGGDLVITADGAHSVEDAEFKSGTITADGAQAELVGGDFSGAMDTGAINDGSLTLTDSTIGTGGDLTIGDGVTLNDATNTGGDVTLAGTGKLDGEYTQDDGTLTLAGGDTGDAKTTFNGGDIVADAPGSVLNDATFNGDVDVDADNGSLTLTNVHVDNGNANLELGDNVTLVDGHLEGGTLTLGDGSKLQGTYEQEDGGTLVIATDDIGDAQATFNGGEIKVADGTDATLNDATFNGNVAAAADGTAGDGKLMIDDAHIAPGGTLDAGKGVTLNDTHLQGGGTLTLDDGSSLQGSYEQEDGGTLVLAGGDADGANSTFRGGEIHVADGVEANLTDATITGNVKAEAVGTESDGKLTITDAHITDGSNVEAGKGVTLVDTHLQDGELTLDDESGLEGSYEQETDGILVIDGGNTGGATDSTFRGGEIQVSDGSDETFNDATFTGDVTIGAVGPEGDGKLTFDDARVTNGGKVEAGQGVTLNDTHLQDGEITMGAGSTLDGTYKQDGGTLILNEGSEASLDDATLSGGEIKITGDGGDYNFGKITINPGSGVTFDVADGNTLTLDGLNITGGEYLVGKNTALNDATVSENGSLLLNNGDTLTGETTLNTGGKIAFGSGSPGSRATIDKLLTDGTGVLSVSANLATGEADKFTIKDSSGGTVLVNAVTIGNGSALPVLVDDNGNIEFSLIDNGYTEEGAMMMQNVLTPDKAAGTGGPRTWSLGKHSMGISPVAQSAANDPAISTSQMATGMMELSRHFRNLRLVREFRESRRGGFETALASLSPEFRPGRYGSNNIWASAYAHRMNVEVMGEASMSVRGIDIGFDKHIDMTGDGWLTLGAVLGGQWLGNLSTKSSMGANGKGDGTAHSLGAYASWMNADGWFVDVLARHYWTDTHRTGFTPAGAAISYSSKRNAVAFRAEAGRKMPFGSWYVEPAAGVTGMWMERDSFATSAGANVSYSATRSLRGDASVTLGYTGERLSPYIYAGVNHEFGGRTNVNYGGTRLRSDASGTRVRGAAGLNFLVDEAVTLYLDVAYERGSGYRDISGNFSITFSW